MALPYEGDTELGNDGAVNEIRPLTGVRRTSTAQYEFDDEEEPKGCWGRTQKSCNDFFLMICPSCVTSIPSIILIILAILIVSFVILSIPLVFALTYSHSSPHVGEQPDGTILRSGEDDYFWPGMGRNGTNDTDYDSAMMDNSDNNTIPAIEKLLPKNVSLCRGFGFVCASDPNFVIGTYARCDGVAQCPDGSDETNCNECQTSFSCPAKNNPEKLNCFRSNLLCDGIPQCSDESDEKLCLSKTCASDQFQCSKMCLPKSFVCDGESHCNNGEDESNCNGKCKNGSKWCAVTNRCIPKWALCDGIQNCFDGSDEAGCDCKSCSGKGRMLCKPDGNENDGFCVRQDKICDGNQDCPNNVDETGCPSRNDILFGVMRKSLKFL